MLRIRRKLWAEDLTSNIYGRLTVLNIDHRRNPGTTSEKTYWKCICICKTIKIVASSNLKTGHTKSCGCLRTEAMKNRNFRKPANEASENTLFARYQYKSKDRGIKWALSKVEFLSLLYANCHYCGIAAKREVQITERSKIFVNGIDRIDSSLDYTLDNVVTACSECNLAKNSMQKEEFLNWIKRVYTYNFNNLS